MEGQGNPGGEPPAQAQDGAGKKKRPTLALFRSPAQRAGSVSPGAQRSVSPGSRPAQAPGQPATEGPSPATGATGNAASANARAAGRASRSPLTNRTQRTPLVSGQGLRRLGTQGSGGHGRLGSLVSSIRNHPNGTRRLSGSSPRASDSTSPTQAGGNAAPGNQAGPSASPFGRPSAAAASTMEANASGRGVESATTEKDLNQAEPSAQNSPSSVFGNPRGFGASTGATSRAAPVFGSQGPSGGGFGSAAGNQQPTSVFGRLSPQGTATPAGGSTGGLGGGGFGGRAMSPAFQAAINTPLPDDTQTSTPAGTPQPTGLFGSGATASGLFGGSGAAAGSTPSPAFGMSPGTNTFGGTPTPIFVGTPAPLFGGGSSAATPPTSQGLASPWGTGASAAAASPFGAGAPASPFGAGGSATTPPATQGFGTGVVFGSGSGLGGASSTPQNQGPASSSTPAGGLGFGRGFGAFGGAAAAGSGPADVHAGEEARKRERAERFRIGASEAGPSAAFPAAEAAAPSIADGGEDYDEERPGGRIEGTCTTMCPDKERDMRSSHGDVDSFERASEGGPPTLAVKKFARNVDQVAPNFRTLEALRRTQAHLHSIMNRTDVPLGKIHYFLWERHRSVRQDLHLQGYAGPEAIGMYEEHVRFMLLAEHELSGAPQGPRTNVFNSHLNLEQINKACISLNGMYDQARVEGRPAENEGEFRAYHLLNCMGSHGSYKFNSTEYSKALKDCDAVRDHPFLRLAIRLQGLLGAKNWVSYFREVQRAPYLLACAAHLYYPFLRAHAINTLKRSSREASIGGSGPTINVAGQRFVAQLQLSSEEEVQAVCNACGLNLVPQTAGGFMVQIPNRKDFTVGPKAVPIFPSPAISALAASPRSADVARGIAPAPWDPAAVQPALNQAPAFSAQPAQPFASMAAQEAAQASRREAWLNMENQRKMERERQEASLREAAEKEAALAKERAIREQQEKEAALAREREAEQRRRLAQQQEEERQRLQQQQEEERRQKELQRQREAEEAEEARRRQREAAERRAAEQREEEARRAKEKAERQRLEAERKQREAAEAEKRRQELIQRRQEQASKILARVSRQRLLRSFLCSWQALVAEELELRRLREERREQALAACLVGARKLPTLRKSLSPLPPPKASPQPVAPEAAPLDISPALVPLLQNSPHACNLFFKLACVHSSPPPSRESPASLWLRSTLLGKVRDSEQPLVKLKTQITMPGRLPAVLHTGIRDVSKAADDKTAMAGVSGVLLFVACQDQPSHIGDRMHALLTHLPKDTPKGPPLLVLVESEELAEPLRTWLKEETSTSAGKRVGSTQVAVLPAQDLGQEARRQALLQGVRWLAENSASQPHLRRASLAELAGECLGATMSGVSGHHAAQPAHFVAAFNTSLHVLAAGVRNTASTTGAVGGWPPADCCLQGDQELLPRGWWQDSVVQRAEQALSAAHLPTFQSTSDQPDEDVRSYLTGARVQLLKSPQARVPWRQALQDAFQLRLLALEAAPPVVVAVPLPLLASERPAPILSLALEDRPKRKRAELPGAACLASGGSTPQNAKQQRTFASPGPLQSHAEAAPQQQDLGWAASTPVWSTGTPQPMRPQASTPVPMAGPNHSPQAVMEQSQPLGSGLDGAEHSVYPDDIDSKYSGDAVVDESLARLEEDKAESEALTASLRALLDVGDEHRESNSVTPSHGVEVETAADFTRFLADLRGGF